MRGRESKISWTDRLLRFNLAISLIILVVLNLIDACFTIIFVDTLGFQEVNPIVAPLFMWGPITFLIWKLLIVVMCCVFIYAAWLKNKKEWVQKFINILLVIYGILVLTHTTVFIKFFMMGYN
jgi:uncharacterized membrane protein